MLETGNNSEEQQDRAAVARSPGPTVVGIGASAGGLGALKQFFQNVPENSNLTFVVVVHLAPEHPSMLADLLQPHVHIGVQQVTETTPLEPNRVYVIPPNANLSAIDTHLRLTKLEQERRERAPIDHFFRTLASTHDGRAVGVILTGTGSDGTLGVREIKVRGGVIIVQDPNEAEFDGMPQSAIATGVVDMVLPVGEIPAAIIRYHQTEPRVPAPTEAERAAGNVDPIPKVLALLRARTERDFTRYKRATILRRIARRMQLNYLEDFESYLERLRQNPEEARALADDLLITVTSFFRDPEVFQRLERETVPEIFQGKSPSDSIRVWSVGCATGEEAYSLAMLLVEEAGRRDVVPRLQVFASDLHRHSLDRAREGFYLGDIETDVSPERLKRFFHKENGGYRVNKELRELVIFAPHNLLSDPPFSRLDLISCRNLLIYLERDVQREVVELFHYSLCPNGHLLLGSAEVVDASELFRTDDKRICLYRKKNVPPPEPRLPVFPMTRGRHAIGARSGGDAPAVPYGELHERMVERYAPPSILVSSEDKIVHLSEHAGRYLVHPGGEVTANVVKLVREELRIEIRSLLQAARESGRASDSKPINVQFNGHARPVVLHVRPSQQQNQDGLVLVLFEEREPEPETTEDTAPGADAESVARVGELQEQVHQLRQRLQATIEEFESSQEEMRAANEEMQSTNEELRSTLEELETSKEELQSINEELQTVNQENRHKVEELSQLSSDLHNLLGSTDIATLFLDRELRILRFTPKVGELFNVRQADRGRPISDLTARIGYPQMRDDAAQVLSRLAPAERELADETGQWYWIRVMPYRNTDDRIDGVVITFIDITDRRRAEQLALDSERRLATELEAMQRLHSLVSRLLPTTDLTTALRDVLESTVAIAGAGMGSIHLYDRDNHKLELVAESGFEQRSIERLLSLDPAIDSPVTHALAVRRRVVVKDAQESGPSKEQARLDGYRGVQATPLLTKDARVLGVLSTYHTAPYLPSDRDVRLLDLCTQQATDYLLERRRAEEELSSSVTAQHLSEQRYQQLFDSIDEGFCIVEVLFDDKDQPLDYRFRDFNPAFEKHTGLTGVLGRTMRDLAPDHVPAWLGTFAKIARTGVPERLESRSEALGRYMDLYAFRTGDPSQRHVAILLRDVSERKNAEEGRELLLRELNHRVKNTLTTVRSIANQTMVGARSPADFAEAFTGRLAALAEAHDLLTQSRWEGAELSSVVRRVLGSNGDDARAAFSGPLVMLRPQATLNLSLVIYELATNARKYGAWSGREGRVALTWSIVAEDGEPHLEIQWIERGGPPVTPPTKAGFGTTLIEQGLKGIGGESKVQFDADGVSCRIRIPLPFGGDQ